MLNKLPAQIHDSIKRLIEHSGLDSLDKDGHQLIFQAKDLEHQKILNLLKSDLAPIFVRYGIDIPSAIDNYNNAILFNRKFVKGSATIQFSISKIDAFWGVIGITAFENNSKPYAGLVPAMIRSLKDKVAELIEEHQINIVQKGTELKLTSTKDPHNIYMNLNHMVGFLDNKLVRDVFLNTFGMSFTIGTQGHIDLQENKQDDTNFSQRQERGSDCIEEKLVDELPDENSDSVSVISGVSSPSRHSKGTKQSAMSSTVVYASPISWPPVRSVLTKDSQNALPAVELKIVPKEWTGFFDTV